MNNFRGYHTVITAPVGEVIHYDHRHIASQQPPESFWRMEPVNPLDAVGRTYTALALDGRIDLLKMYEDGELSFDIVNVATGVTETWDFDYQNHCLEMERICG